MQRIMSEMAQRFREFDWAATSIGPPQRWPASWRTAVDITLASGFPTALALGPQHLYFYNDAFISIGGPCRHPQSIGQPVHTVWKEIWQAALEPRFQETLATGRPTGAEQLMLPLERSGYVEETYMTFSFAALRDEDGTPSGIFCTATENTALVIARRQLECLRRMAAECGEADSPEAACALAAAALDAHAADVPFALIYLFRDGLFELTASAGLSACPHELLTDQGLFAGLDSGEQPSDPGHRPRLIGNLSELIGPLLRAGHAVPREALVVALPGCGSDAPSCILTAGLNPLRPVAESGEFIGRVAAQLAKAIAGARQRAVERGARQRAERDVLARDDFFAALAHEARTPLMSLFMWSKTLRSTHLTRRQRLQAVDATELAARALRRLTDDLHDVGRAASGHIQVDRRQFISLTPLVAAVTDALAPAAAAKRITIHTALERDSGPVVVDADRIQQVLSNLLSNSIRYTPPGGSIEVRCARHAGIVEIRVRDSGRGITPQALPHLFERYWRAEAAWEDGGLGLGLAIARRLLELQDGQIEALSEGEGRGATFIVRLPVNRAAPVTEELVSIEPGSGMHDAARLTEMTAGQRPCRATSGT